jgi:hypothetical protein
VSSGTHGQSAEGPSEGSCTTDGRANYTTVKEIATREEVLAGTFFLNECPIIILFDSGASYDFMSFTCAKKAKLSLVASGAPYMISSSGGRVDVKDWRKRPEGGEWEPIKIPRGNLAYIPKSTQRPSSLARPKPSSYK